MAGLRYRLIELAEEDAFPRPYFASRVSLARVGLLCTKGLLFYELCELLIYSTSAESEKNAITNF